MKKIAPRINGPAAANESSKFNELDLGVKTTIAVGRRYILKQ